MSLASIRVRGDEHMEARCRVVEARFSQVRAMVVTSPDCFENLNDWAMLVIARQGVGSHLRRPLWAELHCEYWARHQGRRIGLVAVVLETGRASSVGYCEEEREELGYHIFLVRSWWENC